MLKTRTATLTILTLVALSAQASATTVSENFNYPGTSLNGWTQVDANGAPGDYTLSHQTSGGPAGANDGYLQGVDLAEGIDSYFSAPSAFLGNKSAYLGGNLSYQLNILSGTPDSVGGGVVVDEVIIAGNGKTVDWSPNTDLVANQWMTFSVDLTTANFGSDLASVLQNVTRVQILAEYVTGGETEGLDNVVLTSGPTVPGGVPEPSTWAMMLLGFAGLGYAGYRSRAVERRAA
jgi:hypothetical protein